MSNDASRAGPGALDVRRERGVNLPWLRYGGDFGANAWRPQGGLATPEGRAEADATLAAIADAGFDLVRWFVLADGRAGIRFAADGTPLGLDGWCLDDVSAALDVAWRRGLRLVPVLFDFTWCRAARVEAGVQIGGRCEVLASPRLRESLVAHVVAPLASRVAGHPALAAWDLFNEPEWVTFGYGGWRPRQVVSLHAMRDLLSRAASVVGAATSRPVTVGLASTRGLGLTGALDLDFYQVHWYDRLAHRAPLDEHVALFGLDRPVVLGEFPTRGSGSDAATIVASARRSGYAAAWPWSWAAADAWSDRDTVVRLGGRHAAGLPGRGALS